MEKNQKIDELSAKFAEIEDQEFASKSSAEFDEIMEAAFLETQEKADQGLFEVGSKGHISDLIFRKPFELVR